jgi:hypothetical protein
MWACQFVKVEVILILALNIIVLHEYATIEVSAQKSEICANLGILQHHPNYLELVKILNTVQKIPGSKNPSISFNMKLATLYTTQCTNQLLPMSFLDVGKSTKWKC